MLLLQLLLLSLPLSVTKCEVNRLQLKLFYFPPVFRLLKVDPGDTSPRGTANKQIFFCGANYLNNDKLLTNKPQLLLQNTRIKYLHQSTVTILCVFSQSRLIFAASEPVLWGEKT